MPSRLGIPPAIASPVYAICLLLIRLLLIRWLLTRFCSHCLQPDRYCQFGYTPYVEMAAISVACGSLDGQCHAPMAWSFGNTSFTMPMHSHARMTKKTVMFLASFQPE